MYARERGFKDTISTKISAFKKIGLKQFLKKLTKNKYTECFKKYIVVNIQESSVKVAKNIS